MFSKHYLVWRLVQAIEVTMVLPEEEAHMVILLQIAVDLLAEEAHRCVVENAAAAMRVRLECLCW